MELDRATRGETPPHDGEASHVEQRERQQPPIAEIVSKSMPGGFDGRRHVPRGEDDTSRIPGASGCRDDGVRVPGCSAVHVDAMWPVRCRHSSEQRYGDQGDDGLESHGRDKGNHGTGFDAFVEEGLRMRVRPAVELRV
jgi:hypothetical protein